MYSTAKDMLNWHHALHDHKLISKEVQDKMFAPYKNSYAMAQAVYSTRNKQLYYRAGAINGFKSFELHNDDDDLYVVLLENHLDRNVDNKKLISHVLGVFAVTEIPALWTAFYHSVK